MKGLEIKYEEKWIEGFNTQFNISRENNKTSVPHHLTKMESAPQITH